MFGLQVLDRLGQTVQGLAAEPTRDLPYVRLDLIVWSQDVLGDRRECNVAVRRLRVYSQLLDHDELFAAIETVEVTTVRFERQYRCVLE